MKGVIVAPYEGHVEGNATLTLEEAARYIVTWEKWEEFITPETINKIIPTVKCRDVIGVHYVPAVRDAVGYHPMGNNYYENHYEREEIVLDFRFEEWAGEWKRDVHYPAIGYRIPYKYQCNELNKVWERCLIEDFPYLKNYEFDAYCPSFGGGKTHDIYVKISYQLDGEEKCTSVYVPVEALIKRDASIIIKHHTDYHTRYNSTSDWLKEKLPVLESEEFKKFAELVNNYKKGE